MQQYSDELLLVLQQPKSWLSLFHQLGQRVSDFLQQRASGFLRPGQPTQRCSSSSTMPELQVLHDLSFTGRQTYLPISVCNGAVPPLRLASRDLCTFTLVLCTYPSVSPQSALSLMYDLNFGLLVTSILPLQAKETAGNQMLCLSVRESITSSGAYTMFNSSSLYSLLCCVLC